MYFVKLFLCAFLIQIATGTNLEKISILNDETESDLACCFGLFEDDLTPQEVEHKSVVILMPVGGVASVKNIFMENLCRKNWWPVEIWQTTQEWVPFNSNQNKYILVQRDEGDEMARTFYESFRSSAKKNYLRSSSSICIVKAAYIRGNHQCSLYSISGLVANSKESTALNVMGVETTPFAYYYAGDLEGIDMSLITTISKKLKMPMFLYVIGANKSDSLGVQSASEPLVNRYSIYKNMHSR